MQWTVKGTNLSVTPSLRAYVENKLVRPVEKFLSSHPEYQAAVLDVDLSYGSRHHKKGKVWEATANLALPQKNLWQQVAAEDMHEAIDELADLLKRELKEYKERSRSRLLRGARQVKDILRFDRLARFFRRGRNRNEGM